MSESSRFRSLEGILSKPPAKRRPLHAVDSQADIDPDADGHTDTALESASSSDLGAGSAVTSADPVDLAVAAVPPAPAEAPAQTDAVDTVSNTTRRRRPGRQSAPTTSASAPPSTASAFTSSEVTSNPGAKRVPASQRTGGTRRVAFRLPEHLFRALSERVVRDGTTQAYVVLDAIETAHADGTLTDLITAQRPGANAGSLFARPAVRGAATASVATEIRLDAGTLAVLDDLVAAAGADTRTQLIIAALEAHLH